MTWQRLQLDGAGAARAALRALDAMSAPTATLCHATSAIAELCAAAPPELIGPPEAEVALARILDAIDERAGRAEAESPRAVRRRDPGGARGGAWRRPPVAAGPVADPAPPRPARISGLPRPDTDRSAGVGEITRAWRRAGLEIPTVGGRPARAARGARTPLPSPTDGLAAFTARSPGLDRARRQRSTPTSHPGTAQPVTERRPALLPRPLPEDSGSQTRPGTNRSAAVGEVTKAWRRAGLGTPTGERPLLAAPGARTPMPPLADGLAAFAARSPSLDRARRDRVTPASRSPGLDPARPGATPAPRPSAVEPVTEGGPPALLPRPAPGDSRSHPDARVAAASPAAGPPRGLGGLASWWAERDPQASPAPAGPARSEPPALPALSPHVRAADARDPWLPAPRGELDPPPSRLAVGQGGSAALSTPPSTQGDGHAATAALAGIDDVTRALERVLVRELRRHGITPEDP